jgi:predicted short-subunit dehydrogenase-like oxidoreductase (DUF2520 family)
LEPTGATKTLGLIGAGKVGTVLAAAFARAGYLPVAALDSAASGVANLKRLVGVVPVVHSAGEVAARADLILIAVPDDVLGKVVANMASGGFPPGEPSMASTSLHAATHTGAGYPPTLGGADVVAGPSGQAMTRTASTVDSPAAEGTWAGRALERVDWHGLIVVHTSGRFGTEILEPLRTLGARTIAIHPAMAFAGDSETDLARIAGTRFAVTASDPDSQKLGASLVAEIGGVPFPISEVDRALYHAALAHGSNHLVTLVVQSAEMLRTCGVEAPASVLQPLLTAALDNALKRGPAGATGPVVRADVGTLREHAGTLSERLQHILPAYLALTLAGIAIAKSAGRISAAQAKQMEDVLTAGNWTTP